VRCLDTNVGVFSPLVGDPDAHGQSCGVRPEADIMEEIILRQLVMHEGQGYSFRPPTAAGRDRQTDIYSYASVCHSLCVSRTPCGADLDWGCRNSQPPLHIQRFLVDSFHGGKPPRGREVALNLRVAGSSPARLKSFSGLSPETLKKIGHVLSQGFHGSYSLFILCGFTDFPAIDHVPVARSNDIRLLDVQPVIH
jgi:hypothetical protein